jgi:hypothetical protein
MLADVTIDGMVEEEFRHAIETLMREGNADHAIKWLKSRLDSVCGPLPERFLSITPADIAVTGWDDIGHRLDRLDALGSHVTAIGIDICDPSHLGLTPDGSGVMAPCIETHFYTDDAWPFSRCERAELLGGYTPAGNRWTGGFAEVDDTIGIEGIDDLYWSVMMLEQTCGPDGDASELERRAYLIGASYLALLIHVAVRETALRHGAPRPLAIMVGSNDSYPGFEAPVLTASEIPASAPAIPRAQTATSSPYEAETTPLDLGQPVQDDHEPLDDHPGLAELRELAQPNADPGQEPEAWSPPEPDPFPTGTQLRRRLITQESIAELETSGKQSLLKRLFRRS